MDRCVSGSSLPRLPPVMPEEARIPCPLATNRCPQGLLARRNSHDKAARAEVPRRARSTRAHQLAWVTRRAVTHNASQARGRADRRWPGRGAAILAWSTAATQARTTGQGVPLTRVGPMGVSARPSPRDLAPVFHLPSKGRAPGSGDDGSWPGGPPRQEGAKAPSGVGAIDTAPPALSETSRTTNLSTE